MNDLLTKDNIIRVLRSATSSNPINSKDIEIKYNVTGEQIRTIIHELRIQKIPIGNTTPDGRKGYFLAKNRKEYELTLRDIAGRKKSLDEIYRAMSETFADELQEGLF